MSDFSPDFLKLKLKISHPKEINCHLLVDFCLANFKFLTDFKFNLSEKSAVSFSLGLKFKICQTLKFTDFKFKTQFSEKLEVNYKRVNKIYTCSNLFIFFCLAKSG
jgi:hypothetical protein